MSDIPPNELVESLESRLRKIFTRDPISAGIISRLVGHIEDLSVQHWPAITDILTGSDDSKITVSFSTEIDRSGAKTHVTTKIGYSKRFKDEAESWVSNPDQPELFDSAREKAIKEASYGEGVPE